MRIARHLIDELIAHAQEDLPNECCGMVGGRDGTAKTIHRADNAEASPLRYSIAPQDQLRISNAIDDAGEELLAIYHSHTRSAAVPSPTDVNLAFYPEALYLIVSLADAESPEVRAWRIVESKVDEVELTIE